MIRCPSCGSQADEELGLCPCHIVPDFGWAENNKIVCDYIHRGIEPKRLGKDDRQDADFWINIDNTGPM